jgi:hypothetical protein
MPETVERCQYLADVSGASSVGGAFASTGLENARSEAREKAAAMGATHIVWVSAGGTYLPNATGHAYDCGGA